MIDLYDHFVDMAMIDLYDHFVDIEMIDKVLIG